MKNLGPASKILRMKIIRDKKRKKLWFPQKKYLRIILEKFNMVDAKFVVTPLASHFKLAYKKCPATIEEKE